MPRPKIGKPPQGLAGEQLAAWYADQYEDAYEKALFEHREERRKAEAEAERLTKELDEAKTKLPGEDTVLLKGKDVETWTELQKIDLDDLRAKAAEGERITRQTFLREAAEATGFNPKTFTELVELRNLKVEKVEVEGQQPAYAVSVEKDGKVDQTPVADYLQAQYADWMPALMPPGATGAPPPALRPPNLGRLPSDPPRRPGNVQEEWLEKVQAESQRSQNVLAQRFTGAGGKS